MQRAIADPEKDFREEEALPEQQPQNDEGQPMVAETAPILAEEAAAEPKPTRRRREWSNEPLAEPYAEPEPHGALYEVMVGALGSPGHGGTFAEGDIVGAEDFGEHHEQIPRLLRVGALRRLPMEEWD